jgi:hypothetical protein
MYGKFLGFFQTLTVMKHGLVGVLLVCHFLSFLSFPFSFFFPLLFNVQFGGIGAGFPRVSCLAVLSVCGVGCGPRGRVVVCIYVPSTVSAQILCGGVGELDVGWFR